MAKHVRDLGIDWELRTSSASSWQVSSSVLPLSHVRSRRPENGLNRRDRLREESTFFHPCRKDGSIEI